MMSIRLKHIILVGDFNTKDIEEVLWDFNFEQDLQNLIKFPTCYKNALKPSVIDKFLTNRPMCFQHMIGLTPGLSDHHKMIATSLKCLLLRVNPLKESYRDMKNFDKRSF